MRRRYVALLRAITNVSMRPFREGLEALGFSDVESYGTSGNLLFNAEGRDKTSLERDITARLGALAIVRSRAELAAIVAADPIGVDILFLAHAPAATRRKIFLELEFESPAPVLRGKTVFFAHPTRLRGRRATFDFESALCVRSTIRTARVVGQLLARM